MSPKEDIFIILIFNRSLKMENLTKATFLEKVFDYENNTEWEYKGERPAIIDFYADWCGPCKMVAPIMEELSKEYDGKVDIYKIDTEAEQELAATFGIRSIPSVLFIPVNDKPQMSVGALPKEGFVEAIQKVFGIENN
jgi:thioredoxin 1